MTIELGGSFYLVLRFCWPKQAAIDGTWKPPAAQRPPPVRPGE